MPARAASTPAESSRRTDTMTTWQALYEADLHSIDADLADVLAEEES